MDNPFRTVKDKSCVLITGGSSGIGFQAAKQLINDKHQLILPCRNKEVANNVALELRREIHKNMKSDQLLLTPIMDLSNLESVKDFASELISRDLTIDTAIFNAGLQYTGSKTPRLSAQGFELTFAVNHLAHQCLAQLILPLVLKSKSPRFVITSSEVHNPNSSGGRIGAAASIDDLRFLAKPNVNKILGGNSNFDADKAYKNSKLCNVLFAREIAKRLESLASPISVIAWAPGLVIPRNSQGFFRHSRKYNELGQRIFAFLARDILQITETPERAGQILMDIAVNNEYCLSGFNYLSNNVKGLGKMVFERSDISNEAKDDELAKSLWEFSSELIGISSTI